MSKSESRNKPTKIFISHSSKDADYVKAFVDLLEYMGIQRGQLFCSSIPGYDIPMDQDIYSYLLNQFYNYDLHMVYMLSQNYYNSPAALNEMGAAWVLRSNYTTILLPGFQYQEIAGAVNPNKIYAKLDEDKNKLKDQLNQIKFLLSQEFDLSDRPEARWDNKLDEFIDEINKITEGILDSNVQENETQSNKDVKAIRKPELVIDVDKNWEIPYKEVEGLDEDTIKAEYRILTMEDVVASKVLVTQEELDKYNSMLPSKEEIDAYIDERREYLLETTCYTRISFDIENSGSCKANDIHITIQFPPEICVLEKAEINNIPAPQKPQKPKDPIEGARIKKMMRQKNDYIDIFGADRISFKSNIPNLSSEIVNSFSWYGGYEIKDNCIEISIRELQHKRKETYDVFAVVARKPGKYLISCEIMCDEYEEQRYQNIDIEVCKCQ